MGEGVSIPKGAEKYQSDCEAIRKAYFKMKGVDDKKADILVLEAEYASCIEARTKV